MKYIYIHVTALTYIQLSHGILYFLLFLETFFGNFFWKHRYQRKLEQLESNLELRRKVEVHEIEERKNLHINNLMKKHEEAFGQIKDYVRNF